MIDLFVVIGDEGKLISIYTDKDKALEAVKPYEHVELWQKNFKDGFEYEDEVTR
jgi:hypothetical protein